jgi:hypothetical protein
LERKLEIEDEHRNKMPAITIFAESIRYLKDSLLKLVNEHEPGTKVTDISWVLTVPAIWEEPAKQMMKEAAVVVSMGGASQTDDEGSSRGGEYGRSQPNR